VPAPVNFGACALKKGKKNKDSKKNVSSNVRIDGFENTDANL
jgi:hypothetical protein